MIFEYQLLESILQRDSDLFRVRVLEKVGPVEGVELPIYGIEMGSEDPRSPVFGLFGGVHGIERIGSQVVIAFLDSVASQLRWDSWFRESFKYFRLVAIPVVNPGGVFNMTRSNPNGVDLMRNAPVDAEVAVPMLAGGHRIGPWLPWYRGKKGEPMEKEAQVLIRFVEEKMFPANFSLALDVHSGFGYMDRLWYPYAKTPKPFPRFDDAIRISALLNRSFPNHVYRIENQSTSYSTHGDLWDFLFDEHFRKNPDKIFIPWTLEMGSWIWVKKNPFQFFSKLGWFHPRKTHRVKRIMRRHQFLLDFFMRVTREYRAIGFSTS